MAYKSTSSAYELPGAKQVGGPLLTSLSAQCTRHSKENMSIYKEDCGLACVSDGATVNRTPLVNVLAVVMSSVMLLSVVDCSGYMAKGGKKDGSFIAKRRHGHIRPQLLPCHSRRGLEHAVGRPRPHGAQQAAGCCSLRSSPCPSNLRADCFHLRGGGAHDEEG